MDHSQAGELTATASVTYDSKEAAEVLNPEPQILYPITRPYIQKNKP